MKYFTPELHTRTSSLDDGQADAAHEEWEKAVKRYEKRLAKIRPAFTSGLKKLTGELRLHDAQLLFFGQREDRCILVFRPEQSPKTMVWLEYAMAAEPVIETDVLPQDLQTNGCFFLYDEIDLMLRNGQRIFSHTILFTNGLHVRLNFRDIKIHAADQLVKVPETTSKKAVTSGLSPTRALR